MNDEIKSDKERYATISIEDEDEDIETNFISKTIEIPKIILEKAAKKKIKKQDNYSTAIRYQPDPSYGLNAIQVDERQVNGLLNKKTKSLVKTNLQIVIDNVCTFFNFLLLTIGIMLIAVGDLKDCFFLVIIAINTTIGIIQEIKAKNVVKKMSLLNSPSVKVKRDGIKERIPTVDLVLDDIFYLKTGEEVPADSFVVWGSVEVNESSLTGESLPIKKNEGDYVLAGSYVVAGSCKCRCDRIGEHNYISQLQKKAAKVKKVKSVLLSSLNKLIKFVSAVVIPVGILIFVNFFFPDKDFEFAIRKTGAQIVTFIPSGLFLLISTALAVSVIKLATKNTLVQDGYAIESLARTNVLCLDKTGTITDGSLLIKDVVVFDESIDYKKSIKNFLNSFEDTNLTSEALIKEYGKDNTYKIKVLLPFSSSRKLSAVQFENEGTFVLGAPEFVIKDKNVLDQSDKYLKDGYRVLLFAKTDEELDENIKFDAVKPICFFIMEDHIRDEAKDTIKWFNDNDVEVKVISGDNPVSVSKIAEKVNLRGFEKYISLDGMTNEEVSKIANEYTIFGRVSPEQKAVLIKTLKDSGNTVAMTGDGVNDILAMKQSNCSIAIASGSEAAKAAAHIVLLDSNFASMPKVVMEGRQVVNNVQRSAALFLMKTIYSMIIAMFTLIMALFTILKIQPFIDLSQPFDLNHLYILEFFVIGFPSIGLALLPNTELIKGSFLKNVLNNAFPGALLLVLSVVYMIVLRDFNLVEFASIDTFETVACINLSLTGLIILCFVCMPFNRISLSLFIGMIALTLLYILVLPTAVTSINLSDMTLIQVFSILLFAIVVAVIEVVLKIIKSK